MAIIQPVIKGSGGSAPAHYIEYPVDANSELTQPTTVATLGNFKIIGESALRGALNYNKQITSVDFSKVEIVKLYGCYGLLNSTICTCVSANFESVVYLASNAFADFARANTNFTTILLSSLKICDSACLSNAFRNTGVSNLSFPALKTCANDSFNLMLMQVSNCTLHFPSNMQTTVEALTGYPNFSGTNTTVLFDLPATVILTGANSVNYERNPKYDTATALAWRVQDTGTAPNLVIDWTPFYTSGTTDPAVSDTIYSDAACTTAVTTISSIA